MRRRPIAYTLRCFVLLLFLSLSFANLPVAVHAGSSDLKIDSVWLEDASQPGQPISQVSSGQSFLIVATIKNVGQETAAGFYVDAYYDSDYGRGGPDNALAGEAQVWYVGAFTGQDGIHTTKWVVDPDNLIAELDEGNNQKEYTFTIGQQTTTTTITRSSATGIHWIVRGTDNHVYYAADLGGTWIALPSTTSDSPAACVCGGVLHMVVRRSNNAIYYGYVLLSTDAFSAWTRLPGSTASAPALAAASDCSLYLVVRGKDNGIYLNSLPMGGSWSGWQKLPGSTIHGPAATVAGSTLNIAVVGSDGSSIWHGRKNLSSGAWLGWSRVSGSTPSKPALAAVSDAEVYLAVRGSDNRVYVNRWSETAWTGWNRIPTGSTLNGPSITVANGELFVALQGTNGGIYWCSRSLPSGSWSSWTRMPGSTPSSPTLA